MIDDRLIVAGYLAVGALILYGFTLVRDAVQLTRKEG